MGETTYRGGCHCGRVAIEVRLDAPPARLIDCNCTICAKKGILHLGVEPDRLSVLQGGDAIETYRFGSGVAEHNFCRTCGIHVYGRPRNSPERLTINARCLDAFDAIRAGAEIVPFDGQNHPKDRKR